MTDEELSKKLNGVSLTALTTFLSNAGKLGEYLKSVSRKEFESDDVQIPESERRKILGNRVKIMRELRGLRQAELGKRIGTSQSFITNIETGRRGASLNNLVALSQALNVSIDWLIDAPPLKPENVAAI
ncbi:MAG: helix-turn-helix transcriptional regulator [Selenomonadaceae bacterium]|nr:helix-turn-helix transcriptional regulator [Selenomonadaceae bacterium]